MRQPLSSFVGVNSLLSRELKIFAVGGDLKKGNLALRFDDAERVDPVAVDENVIEVSDAEVAGFDVRVIGTRVEMS